MLVQAFEDAGQSVCRVVIEGKRAEVYLSADANQSTTQDSEFDPVEMKK